MKPVEDRYPDELISFSYNTLENAIVATAKDQILALVRSNTNDLPATVSSFSELHDYIDANLLGGAELLLELLGLDAITPVLNRAQDRIDRWIKDGTMKAEAFQKTAD